MSDRAIDEATRAGAIDADLAKLLEHEVSPAAAEKMAAAIPRRRDVGSTTASSPRWASSPWIMPRHDIGNTSVLFGVARIYLWVARIYLWARGQRNPIARMTHRPMC
jgi:hypothetical protein